MDHDVAPDEILAQPPHAPLSDSPRVAPLPGQAAIIHRAVAHARRLGLTIPAGLRIHCVDVARPEEHSGAQTLFDRGTGRLEVWLNVGTRVSPEALAMTVLHEAQHVHDAVTGRPFDRVDWERRAVRFAARAMEEHWSARP